MDEKKAYAYALRLLSKRAYLSVTLSEKLAGKGAPAPVVQTVLDKVTRLGYVDDAEYVRRYAQERTRRGYGPGYIRSALRQKGLSPDFIRETLQGETGGEDPVETAVRALKGSSAFRRRPKPGEDPRRRSERCYAFLARRGFGASVILSAVRAATREDVEY